MPGKPTVEEIRARLRVVCICMGIKAGTISDAIRAGATSVQQVDLATGSGAGECGATRCRPVIEAMLRNGDRPPLPSAPPEPSPQDDDFWFPTPRPKKKAE
jgi:bacterioferritin-associated ferredoxin